MDYFPRPEEFALPSLFTKTGLRTELGNTMKKRLFASNCFPHLLSISFAQWHYRSQ